MDEPKHIVTAMAGMALGAGDKDERVHEAIQQGEIGLNQAPESKTNLLENHECTRDVNSSNGTLNAMSNDSPHHDQVRSICDTVLSDMHSADQALRYPSSHGANYTVVNNYPHSPLHLADKMANHSNPEFAAASGLSSERYHRNERIPHHAAPEVFHHNTGTRQHFPSELGYRSEHGAHRPGTHIHNNNLHPLVNSSHPVYPFSNGLSYANETGASFHHSQLFRSSERNTYDPGRGVPRNISIDSTASGLSQSLGYRSEHGLHRPVANGGYLRHPYQSVGDARSLYPSPCGVASHASGTPGYHAHMRDDSERRRSDPVRGVTRSKSYEPSPHDHLANTRKHERSSRRPDVIEGRRGELDRLRGVPRSISYESSPYDHLDSTRSGERSSHRPHAQYNSVEQMGPSRGVSRSKSYEATHYDLLDSSRRNERNSRRPDVIEGRRGEHDPVRGVPRSISYESSPYDHLDSTRSSERSSRRPHAQYNPVEQSDPSRGVSRSKSYEATPYDNLDSSRRNERNSRRPDVMDGRRGEHDPVRGISRSKSYDPSPHNQLGTRRGRRPDAQYNIILDQPDPCRGVPRSISLNACADSRKSIGNEGSFSNPDSRGKRIEKEDSVKDGEMDAYRAMANASDRTRKKKLNEVSYVKVALGNGLIGYVKAIPK